MIASHRLTVPFALLCVFPIAFAAETRIEVGSDTYYLHTNTPGGSCSTRYLGDTSPEAVCSDGDTVVVLNTVRGCLDSTPRGYCAKNEPHVGNATGSQLNCPAGVSYWTHSGKPGDNHCIYEGGFKLCESSDGSHYAEADCVEGCLRSGGAGVCCKAGTDGCGPP
jgi:hypothetical protein